MNAAARAPFHDQAEGLRESCGRLPRLSLAREPADPKALAGALDCTLDWIGIADQADGFAWRDL